MLPDATNSSGDRQWDRFLSPLAVQQLATFIDMPAVRSTLLLPAYTLADVSQDLEAALPAQWAPPRASGLRRNAGPPTVAWRDGQAVGWGWVGCRIDREGWAGSGWKSGRLLE